MENAVYCEKSAKLCKILWSEILCHEAEKVKERLRVKNKFGLVMLECLDLTPVSRLLTIVLGHIEDVYTASNAKLNDAKCNKSLTIDSDSKSNV